MHKAIWTGVAVAAGLVLAGNAHAQLFGGIDPTQLIYKPVDTSNSVVPIAQPMTLPFTNWTLPSFFPTAAAATGQQVVGFSSFPTQAQMPGLSYLSAFGYQRLAPAK